MRRRLQLLRTLLIIVLFAASSSQAQNISDNWDSRYDLPGIEGEIESLLPDGQGGLYIKGQIRGANGAPEARDILYWDGTAWSGLGINDDRFMVDGIEMRFRYQPRDQLAILDGVLYTIASDVNQPQTSYIIYRNGGGWSILEGATFSGIAAKLVTYGSTLYVGGSFSGLSGLPDAQGLVSWDGQGWQNPTGTPIGDASGFVIGTNGTIYTDRARWSGGQWSSYANSQWNIVYLVPAGTELYAMGTANREDSILHLQGNTWTALPPPSAPIPSAQIRVGNLLGADTRSRIYASAYVTTPSEGYGTILRWDGSVWEELPHRFAGNIQHMVLQDDGAFIATGSYDRINDDVLAHNIARWNGSEWQNYASSGRTNEGLAGTVEAVGYYDGYFYAGGSNLVAEGIPGYHGILRWSEETGWETLAEGVGGEVHTIIPYPEGGLLAGGCFTFADGKYVNNIAIWNGSGWYPVGDGVDGCVHDLATADERIYAIGDKSLRKLENGEWVTIPLSIGTGQLHAVAAGDDGSVYVGGQFTSVGGLLVNNVARWKSGAWSSLQDGVKMRVPSYVFANSSPASVHALAVHDGNLYVGGRFDSAGTIPAFQIARWDGTAWYALDSGLVGAYFQAAFGAPGEQATVQSIRFHEGTLYACGKFFGAGTWDWRTPAPRFTIAHGLARWDAENSVWNALGYASLSASDIAFGEEHMFVGGSGPKATSDKFSYGVARSRFPSETIALPATGEELAFGDIVVGRSAVRELTITNPSSSQRTMTGSVVVQYTPFSLESSEQFSLASGQSMTVPVRFAPTTTGSSSGEVIIYHNATESTAPVIVPITGTGIAQSISWDVTPGQIDFGTDLQNAGSKELPVTITNTAGSNASLTIQAQEPAGPFSLEPAGQNDDPLEPVTLQPGESYSWTIRMDMSEAGDFSGAFVVHHDAPDGTISVPLSGNVKEPFAEISVNPSRLDFEQVDVNLATIELLEIACHPQTNVFAAYRLQYSGSVFNVPGTGIRHEMAPGEKVTVPISFQPKNVGVVSDTMYVIKEFDSGTETVAIPLRGEGLPTVARMRISDTAINFGEIAVNKSATVRLKITNLPNASAALTFSHSSLSAPFSVNQVSGIELEPGQETSLELTFTPTSSGQFTDTLFITHNAEGFTNPLPIPMRGESSVSGVNRTDALQAGLALFAEPNPVSGTGSIRFRIQNTADVSLRLFTLDGREIIKLAENRFEAGEHRIPWDTKELAAGTYLCRLSMNGRETSITVNVK